MRTRGAAPSIVRLLARVALAAAVLTFPAAISARDQAPPADHGFLQGKAGSAASANTATLPPGFSDTAVFSGLIQPTNLRFASDGRVFVAEKSGLLKVFDSPHRHDADVVADLSGEVDDYWDRGLLGLALDPTSRRRRTSTSSTPTTRRFGQTRTASGTTRARRPPARRPTDASVSGKLIRLTAHPATRSRARDRR